MELTRGLRGGRPVSAHGCSRAAGISRPEVVFLLAVCLLMASLAVPGWFAYARGERVAAARWDLRELVAAAKRFYVEYGTWPVVSSEGAVDVRYGGDISNAELMNLLRAAEDPAGLNVHRMIFLEAPAFRPGRSGLDAEGRFLDPWGTPYQIVLDANLDNICDTPNSVYNNMIGEGIIAWSCGPDRVSDTSDDILSWTARRPVEMETAP